MRFCYCVTWKYVTLLGRHEVPCLHETVQRDSAGQYMHSLPIAATEPRSGSGCFACGNQNLKGTRNIDGARDVDVDLTEKATRQDTTARPQGDQLRLELPITT